MTTLLIRQLPLMVLHLSFDMQKSTVALIVEPCKCSHTHTILYQQQENKKIYRPQTKKTTLMSLSKGLCEYLRVLGGDLLKSQVVIWSLLFPQLSLDPPSIPPSIQTEQFIIQNNKNVITTTIPMTAVSYHSGGQR